MTTQKQRWANKAAKRAAWAANAEAKADAILNSQPAYASDWAFVSQPGHMPARAKMIAQQDRAFELRAQAEAHRAKAANLEALASRNAGDAEAARQAKRDTLDIKPGDTVVTILYGVREVVRVNKKTLSVRDSFGGTMTVDKAHCRAA